MVADRLNGGILAALLVYALLFQSIATGLATAHMAVMQAGCGSVPCDASAPAHHGHESSDRSQGCCAASCLAACCAAVASISPDHEAVPGFERSKTATLRHGRLGPVSIQRRGLHREARAPPPISA
jgi:hypothetical protein